MHCFFAPRFWKFFAASVAFFGGLDARAQTPTMPDPAGKPTVTGKFVGNGKEAAVKFVTVRDREPFSDKEAIELIFSEKDAASSKRPSMDAMFGKLGSALTLSVFHDGGIFGCEVSHAAHSKRGFSSLGTIKMVEFKIEGGNVTGHVSTGKELDTFGEKWEVDLKFSAPLPEKLRKAPMPASKPVAGDAVPPTKPEAPDEEEAPKPVVGPQISARKLPLPKDAATVSYKGLVKQIHFTSPRPVAAVAKEFSTNLAKQGWKDATGSLMGKQNAILKRKLGEAELTVMIQHAASGCTVKILTEGLDWSDVEVERNAGEPSATEIEAEAKKQLQEALKGLPKGL